MNRKDIANLNNIFKLVIEQAGGEDNVTVESDTAYDKEGQNLRKTVIYKHIFEDTKGKTTNGYEYTYKKHKGVSTEPIVTFFTKKNSPRDLLHNANGPAIIFPDGTEVYCIEGQEVDKSSKEYRSANADLDLSSRGYEKLDDEDTDFFS